MGNNNIIQTEKDSQYDNNNKFNNNQNKIINNSKFSQKFQNPKNIMNFLIKAEENILLSNLSQATSVTFNNLWLLQNDKIKNNLIEDQIKYIQLTDEFINKKTKGNMHFSYRGKENYYLKIVNDMLQNPNNNTNKRIYQNNNNTNNYMSNRNYNINNNNRNDINSYNPNNNNNSFIIASKMNNNFGNADSTFDSNKKDRLNLSFFSANMGRKNPENNKYNKNNNIQNINMQNNNRLNNNISNNNRLNNNIPKNNIPNNNKINNNEIGNKEIKMKTFKIGKKEDFMQESNFTNNSSLNNQEKIIIFSESENNFERPESPYSIQTIDSGTTNNINSSSKSTFPSDKVIKLSNNNNIIIRNRKDKNVVRINSPQRFNYKRPLSPPNDDNNIPVRNKSPKNNERNKIKLLLNKIDENNNQNNITSFNNIQISKAIQAEIKNNNISNNNNPKNNINSFNNDNTKNNTNNYINNNFNYNANNYIKNNKKNLELSPKDKKIKKIKVEINQGPLNRRVASPMVNKKNIDNSFSITNNIDTIPFSDDENNSFIHNKFNHSNLDIKPKSKIKVDGGIHNNSFSNNKSYINQMKTKKKNFISKSPYKKINNNNIIIPNKNERCITIENEGYVKKKIIPNIAKSPTTTKAKPIFKKNIIIKKLPNNIKDKNNINKNQNKKIINNNENIIKYNNNNNNFNNERLNKTQNSFINYKNNDITNNNKIVFNNKKESISPKKNTNKNIFPEKNNIQKESSPNKQVRNIIKKENNNINNKNFYNNINNNNNLYNNINNKNDNYYNNINNINKINKNENIDDIDIIIHNKPNNINNNVINKKINNNFNI